MEEWLAAQRPTPAGTTQRLQFIEMLARHLRRAGQEIDLEPYGSVVSGLWNARSDIDATVLFRVTSQQVASADIGSYLSKLRRLLSDIVPWGCTTVIKYAKHPILSIRADGTRRIPFNVDISVNGQLSVEKSGRLKAILELMPAAADLCRWVKEWTYNHRVGPHPAVPTDHRLNSYTWNLIAACSIFYWRRVTEVTDSERLKPLCTADIQAFFRYCLAKKTTAPMCLSCEVASFLLPASVKEEGKAAQQEEDEKFECSHNSLPEMKRGFAVADLLDPAHNQTAAFATNNKLHTDVFAALRNTSIALADGCAPMQCLKPVAPALNLSCTIEFPALS